MSVIKRIVKFPLSIVSRTMIIIKVYLDSVEKERNQMNFHDYHDERETIDDEHYNLFSRIYQHAY